jgi:hypothetical protein
MRGGAVAAAERIVELNLGERTIAASSASGR